MVLITGDTHGDNDFDKLLPLKEKNLTRDDYLIICGDAGIVWSKLSLDDYINKYSSIGCTVIYVDGNHENFDMLNTFPVVEFKEAKMHKISEYIYHVLRGEIMVLEGRKFLCVGGAVSTDKQYRTPGISWWKQEEITDADVDNAIINLKKYDNKVDCVVTHCCDTHTVVDLLYHHRNICTDQLNFVDQVVDYKYWFFGHYHVDYRATEKKICLYNQILEIIK